MKVCWIGTTQTNGRAIELQQKLFYKACGYSIAPFARKWAHQLSYFYDVVAAVDSHRNYKTAIKDISQKHHASDVCRISSTTHRNIFYQVLADTADKGQWVMRAMDSGNMWLTASVEYIKNLQKADNLTTAECNHCGSRYRSLTSWAPITFPEMTTAALGKAAREEPKWDEQMMATANNHKMTYVNSKSVVLKEQK